MISVFLIIFSVILFPGVLGLHQWIRGFIRYSNGSNIPNNVAVNITNLNNANWKVVYTQQTGDDSGYYLVNVEDLSASDGHIINVSVSYGGCYGAKNVPVNKSQGTNIYCNVTIYGNLPPNTPSQPSGNISENHGIAYNYSTSAWDPDNESIFYWFDWGDGSNSGWIGPYNSNETCTSSHSWTTPGNYTVKAKAKDEHDAESIVWSTPLNVNMTNQPPSGTSTPSGITNGYTDVSYTYSTNATDSNNDNLYYLFNWGDGTNSSWVGSYASGATGSGSHSWATPNTYQVKVKVRDEHGLENVAGWSNTLNITIAQAPSINLEPVADFKYMPTNPQVNQIVNFTDESVDSDGTIVNWSWSFGDGTNSSEQNPNHTYIQSGNYQVNLTVKDNENATDTKQQTIYISAIPSEINWSKTTQITLKYNNKNKGINYLVWKGAAINASSLAENTSLSKGDSISIFSKNDGTWLTYTVGLSNQSDFQISLWDIIMIKTTSEKTIAVDTSQQNISIRSVTINFATESETQRSNTGYNFFAWTSNIVISIEDFVKNYGFSKDYIAISLYDAGSSSWVTYSPLLPAVFNKHFTIQSYSIICIHVAKDFVERTIIIT